MIEPDTTRITGFCPAGGLAGAGEAASAIAAAPTRQMSIFAGFMIASGAAIGGEAIRYAGLQGIRGRPKRRLHPGPCQGGAAARPRRDVGPSTGLGGSEARKRV